MVRLWDARHQQCGTHKIHEQPVSPAEGQEGVKPTTWKCPPGESGGTRTEGAGEWSAEQAGQAGRAAAREDHPCAHTGSRRRTHRHTCTRGCTQTHAGTHMCTHTTASATTVSAQPLGREGGKGHINHQRLFITQAAQGLGFLLLQGFYPVRTDGNRRKTTSEAEPVSVGATQHRADPTF